MVPRADRSIRNIPLSTAHRRAPVVREEHYEPMPMQRRPQKRRGFLWAIVGVVLICAIAGILLSTLFAGATVTVFAREEQISLPQTFQANINPAAGGLPYVSMTITRAATTSITASGTRQVSRPASGVITVYNTYSTSPQRLITNTRFEAPDGKIYRIHEPIEVPGATQGSGTALTPGTATITVYADSPGAEYNRGATKFTIPGFKGDPRYETFYAEAAALVGGFVGTEPAVAGADLTKASAALQQDLENAINSAITSQLPDGFIPVSGAFDITFSDIAQSPGQGNTALLSQSATASAAIVRVSDLAAAIARAGVEGYTGEAVTLSEPNAVTVAVASTTKPVGTLTITASGNSALKWQYDPIALKQALLGKEKSAFEDILETFRPAITKAEAKVRPFWQGNFPSDPEKITVTAALQE